MNEPNKKQLVSSYIIQSQEEEIKRISIELHEGVGQNLYSILTGMQFVETNVNEPYLKSYIGDMSQLIQKTIQEIRLLSIELHPPGLTTFGLLSAIKSYLKLYTSTFGVLVELTSDGEEKTLPDSSGVAVFRVCQEALSNIAKYADTSHVNMKFVWKATELNITICDFGKGFQLEDHPEEHSFGIAAMKERMLLIGGECLISSKMGEGTTVHISLPI